MANVFGTDNAETINALDGVTNGADTIFGFGGNDVIFGLGGNDEIKGGGGADQINGGSGTDTANYSDSGSGVTVSLESGQGFGGTAEGDTLSSIENLTGSAHDDFLVGNAGNNVLVGLEDNDILKGGGGADTLYGDSGNDTLKGGGGADTLNGGSGIDTANYAESSAAVFISLITDAASGGDAEGDELNSIENVTGSAHDDVLLGNDGTNVLRGNDGEDLLKGYGGADTLFGGDHNDDLFGMDGNDTLRGENGNDMLDGGANNDTLFGGAGNDQLVGGSGIDLLRGESGDDVLEGGNDNDTLIGGAGNDNLTGGGGIDAFWFDTALNLANNIDVITDFSVAQDAIVLDDAIFNTLVGAGSNIADFEFRIGPAAADADDRIIYDQTTGALYFDADGSGAIDALQFAGMTPGLELTHFNFIIV